MEYIINPFNDYGYIPQEKWIGAKAQLEAQGVETEYYVEFGKGFVAGSPEPSPAKSKYLTFTANEDECFISLNKVDFEGGVYSLEEFTAEYSVDNGNTWNEYTWTDEGYGIPTEGLEIELNNRESVKFRGHNEEVGFNDSGAMIFSMSGEFNASGDVTSLINGIGGDCELPNYAFSYMFKECTGLLSSPNLPSTILSNYCYNCMFYNCESLTTAPPELPATTLATYCYASMFYGCTLLTTAPVLPATTLSESCYSYMFYECRSLTTAPALPATTLTDYCYSYMFRNCTSLTTAPELPATTLVSHCYHNMFSGCTLLNSVTCLATDISEDSCTSYWLYNVAQTGTFTKAASMSGWTTGVSGIPSGWTVESVS